MSGNPISIQHQRHAPLLSEDTLQGPGTHRTSHRQTQALQTYRASMREDGAELRLIRRACSRLHLDQIRPHGLVRLFDVARQLLDTNLIWQCAVYHLPAWYWTRLIRVWLRHKRR